MKIGEIKTTYTDIVEHSNPRNKIKPFTVTRIRHGMKTFQLIKNDMKTYETRN